jgi:hypothetical protein
MRKSKESSPNLDITKPITLKDIPIDDNDCFGFEWEPLNSDCSMCSSQTFCAIIFTQNQLKKDKEIEHIFKYNTYVQGLLLWHLVVNLNIRLNRHEFLEICKDFIKFLEDESLLTKNGIDRIEHFNAIDIEAEMLYKYIYLKYKVDINDMFTSNVVKNKTWIE